MAKTRVGVVGVGHLGYHHARNYAALENVTLVGVVDPNEEHGAKAKADFGAPWHRTLDGLLAAGIEAASAVVPTMLHFEVTRRLLEAGVDVLVEKPIAATLEDAKNMVSLAAKHGRLLQVGHIERFNGAVIAVMERFKEPKFIECHRLSPYPSRGDDVSVILDLMIHDLDIVRALDRSKVISLDAVGVPVFSEFEDIANARIRFASGCVANLTCSRVSVDRMRKIRIFAQNAYVSTDYAAQEVLVYSRKPGTLEEGMSPMELISIDPLPVKRDEPLKLELASFIECVRERKQPVVSGEDGLAALELAHEITTFIKEHS